VANRAGGILAGITNGEQIVIRAACKPIPSIRKEQETIDIHGNPRRVSVPGRHDACVIPRIIPVCEAMVCMVVADHLLRQKSIS
jgi:chorismate synthase